MLSIWLPLMVQADSAAADFPPFPGSLEAGPQGMVAEVLSPVALKIKGMDRPVRLAGLWPGEMPGAASQAATQALAALVRGRAVQLHLDQRTQDWRGHWLVHVSIAPGSGGSPRGETWIQGRLPQQGHARVYTTKGNEALAAEMLGLEEQARQAGRGLWRLPEYAVRPALALDHVADSFQIIQGEVVSVAVTGGRVYLNFGKDWRQDFTVVIPRPDVSGFPGRLRGVRALAGKHVRVRGWVFRLNGPAIRADHGTIVEVLKE